MSDIITWIINEYSTYSTNSLTIPILGTCLILFNLFFMNESISEKTFLNKKLSGRKYYLATTFIAIAGLLAMSPALYFWYQEIIKGNEYACFVVGIVFFQFDAYVFMKFLLNRKKQKDIEYNW